MKLLKNGTVILVIALLGVAVIIGGELYIHLSGQTAAPHTAQEIAEMHIERVNINTASYAELAAAPGITENTAKAIVAYRKEHGDFTCVEELLNVRGIGEKRYAQMAPYLTVE